MRNMNKAVWGFLFSTIVLGTSAFSEATQRAPAGDYAILECEKEFNGDVHTLVFKLLVGESGQATHFTLRGSTPAGPLDFNNTPIEAFAYNTDIEDWGTYVLVEYFNFSNVSDEPFRGPELMIVDGTFKGFTFDDGEHNLYSFAEANCQAHNIKTVVEKLKN